MTAALAEVNELLRQAVAIDRQRLALPRWRVIKQFTLAARCNDLLRRARDLLLDLERDRAPR